MIIGLDARVLSEPHRSGVATYAHCLFAALLALPTNDHYVLLTYGLAPKTDARFQLLQDLAAHPRVVWRHVRVPSKLMNLSLWLFGYPKINRLMGEIDVVLMPNPNFFATDKEVPVVVTFHDLAFAFEPDLFSFRQRWWHRAVAPHALAARATRLISVSYATKQDIVEQFGVPDEKVTVVHSGLSASAFREATHAEQDRVRARYNLPKQFLLCLATHEPRKNMAAALAAFTILAEIYPDLHVVLAGFPGWGKVQTTMPSALQSRVHVLHTLAEDDKRALYSLASVFVFPSLYEGFGFPPLEAMAQGVPVVASNRGSLPEVLGDAVMLIDPYKPQSLAAAIRLVLDDQTFVRELTFKAKKHAHRFQWSRTAAATHVVLEQTKNI